MLWAHRLKDEDLEEAIEGVDAETLLLPDVPYSTILPDLIGQVVPLDPSGGGTSTTHRDDPTRTEEVPPASDPAAGPSTAFEV